MIDAVSFDIKFGIIGENEVPKNNSRILLGTIFECDDSNIGLMLQIQTLNPFRKNFQFLMQVFIQFKDTDINSEFCIL